MIACKRGPGVPEYDSEAIHFTEPYGWHLFAWTPKRCRNGKIRWLKWLERHGDGSYTLGRGG